MKILLRGWQNLIYNSFRIVFFAGVLVAFTQLQPSVRASQTQGAPSTGTKIARAVRVDRAPRLDGTLNDPMWQAAEHRRAFLVCEGNNLMVVFDLGKHQPIAFLPIPAGGDVIKFDPGLKRVYVACYSGAIAVIQQDDPDHYRKLEDFAVQRKVHSLAVDVNTHRVYAPEQEEEGRPVSRMIVYDVVK